jgi:hypothetical protein
MGRIRLWFSDLGNRALQSFRIVRADLLGGFDELTSIAQRSLSFGAGLRGMAKS